MTDFEYTAEPTPLNTQRIHSGTDPIEYTAEPTPLCTIMKNEFLSKAESDKQKTAALKKNEA